MERTTRRDLIQEDEEEELSNKVDYSSLRRQAFQVTYSMPSKLLPADDGNLQNKNSALAQMSVLIHQKFFVVTSFIKYLSTFAKPLT